jgi:hypothetical protein
MALMYGKSSLILQGFIVELSLDKHGEQNDYPLRFYFHLHEHDDWRNVSVGRIHVPQPDPVSGQSSGHYADDAEDRHQQGRICQRKLLRAGAGLGFVVTDCCEMKNEQTCLGARSMYKTTTA